MWDKSTQPHFADEHIWNLHLQPIFYGLLLLHAPGIGPLDLEDHLAQPKRALDHWGGFPFWRFPTILQYNGYNGGTLW